LNNIEFGDYVKSKSKPTLNKGLEMFIGEVDETLNKALCQYVEDGKTNEIWIDNDDLFVTRKSEGNFF